MKLSELIAQGRKTAYDTALPPFCSDEEWTGFFNEAQDEACRRSRLIVDSVTPEICRVNLSPTKSVYPIDDRIIFIRRAKLKSASHPLKKVSYKYLDQCQLGWETEVGKPRGYIEDLNSEAITPYPMPDEPETLTMTVVRLPLCRMSKPNDCPEINPRLHKSLEYWALFRFYSKQDMDSFDPKKAADYLALFTNEFGEKSSAIDETWIQEQHGYIPDEGTF